MTVGDVGKAELERLRPSHCWVAGMPNQVEPFPAVLTDWRQDDHGSWWGRVVYSSPGPVEQTVVCGWVDARYVKSVDPRPTPPAIERRRNPH